MQQTDGSNTMTAQLVPPPSDEQIAAANRGEPTASLAVEWNVEREQVPNFEFGTEGCKGTLIVQRACDPTKIHLGTLIPEQRWAVSSYFLTEDEATQLAVALLLAVKGGPWIDDDESDD